MASAKEHKKKVKLAVKSLVTLLYPLLALVSFFCGNWVVGIRKRMLLIFHVHVHECNTDSSFKEGL